MRIARHISELIGNTPLVRLGRVTQGLAPLVLAALRKKMVALAVLAPIVASQAGNAATQTMTVAVRALATRELTRGNAMRVVRRDVARIKTVLGQKAASAAEAAK